jgi:hypothetical protein
MRAGSAMKFLTFFLLFTCQTVLGKVKFEGSWECDYGYSHESYDLTQNLSLNFDSVVNLYSIKGVLTISPLVSNESFLYYDSLVKYTLVDKKMHSETVEFKVERLEDPNGFFDQATLDAMSDMSSNSIVELTESGALSFQYEDGLKFDCKRQ